jgi:phospholipase/carboxylesterase
MATTLEAIEIETGANPDAAVVWLHGLGADGNDFVPVVPELGLDDMAVRFVFPHAPTQAVTINNGMVMRAWYDISDAAIRREDERGVRASQAHIEALIQREKGRGIREARIVLAGFSQGGAMALHTGLRHEAKLAGILALSCYLPLATAVQAEVAKENGDTPIFMGHGISDPVVQYTRALESRKMLETLGYRVEWHEYRMPHSVCMEEIQDIGAWLRRVLGNQD